VTLARVNTASCTAISSGTGTGPFKITKVTGKSKAALDRYDGYWGGKAKASGIDVTWIADGTARANALRSGDVDIAEWIPPPRRSRWTSRPVTKCRPYGPTA
jgi:peptide/nickel transport system substrate-binding protein